MLVVVLLWAGCALPPGMEGPQGAVAGASAEMPPPGYGTLRQEQVSISISSGSLQILVTPLAESVIRVTAPDTYQRLSSLAVAHRGPATDSDDSLFLVSFFSDQADMRFVPEEVQIVSRGVRVRPGTITPITPTWGSRRLRQRETEMAVYAFAGAVDLEADLTLMYGLERSTEWSVILPRIHAERVRARARAGGRLRD